MSAARKWPTEPTVWPASARATCPFCGERVQLRENGTLAQHLRFRIVGRGDPLTEMCPGSHELPKESR